MDWSWSVSALKLKISTDGDQIAIAPGYLQNEWKADGRNFYSYKMEAPMCNFYSIVSARYAVKRDKWNDVNLEIYYHPGHEYNLDKMMEGMKDALTYYSKNFAPYQYRRFASWSFPVTPPLRNLLPTPFPSQKELASLQKLTILKRTLTMCITSQRMKWRISGGGIR